MLRWETGTIWFAVQVALASLGGIISLDRKWAAWRASPQPKCGGLPHRYASSFEKADSSWRTFIKHFTSILTLVCSCDRSPQTCQSAADSFQTDSSVWFVGAGAVIQGSGGPGLGRLVQAALAHSPLDGGELLYSDEVYSLASQVCCELADGIQTCQCC